jgi:hypothetical protein
MDYSHQRVFAWVAAACTVFITSTSFAANLNVCMDSCVYKTVQSAVDAAVEGDTVRIYPGRYVGNITTAGKELTFTGTSQAASEVLLVGTGVGPVFTLGGGSNGTSPHAIFISYVTVTGGSHFQGTGEGGGIQVRQGAVLILSNANVVGNTAAAGGGISVDTPGTADYSLIQSSCIISSNTAYVGGGVYVAPNSNARIEDQCVVTKNSATGNPGPTTPGLGGGIYAGTGSQLTLSQVNIAYNFVTAPCGGGFTGAPDCVAAGGGAYVLGQLTMIEDQITQNNVYNASGASLGGGLYVNVSPTQLIQGSVIASNSVYSIAEAGSGGGVYAASSDPTVSWTLDGDFIVLNTAGDANQPAHPSAGGVQNVGKLSLINGSSIAGNVPVQCLGGKGCPAN